MYNGFDSEIARVARGFAEDPKIYVSNPIFGTQAYRTKNSIETLLEKGDSGNIQFLSFV